jgi:hypothetical protein
MRNNNQPVGNSQNPHVPENVLGQGDLTREAQPVVESYLGTVDIALPPLHNVIPLFPAPAPVEVAAPVVDTPNNVVDLAAYRAQQAPAVERAEPATVTQLYAAATQETATPTAPQAENTAQTGEPEAYEGQNAFVESSRRLLESVGEASNNVQEAA